MSEPRTILVTGATGLTGGAVVRRLSDRGVPVRALVRHTTTSNAGKAAARIASIDVGDVAEVAADVLTGSGHEGAVYPLTGPEALTMAEVADRLADATGMPVRYVDVPPDAARQAQLDAGMPPYLADGLFELFAERRRGKEAIVSTVTHDVFGRSPTHFDEFARRNAAVFRGQAPPPGA